MTRGAGRVAAAPRIAPVDVDALPLELRALIERSVSRYGRVLNVFPTLANHPALFKRWYVLAGHSERSTLPPRERESPTAA